MSYINKNSLRDEFDTLKSDFEQLSKKEKLSPEFLTLFKALFMLFELMMAVFMEKKTAKDNKNSGKPSSQTEKDNTSTSSHIGSKKKQRQENTAHFDSRRSIETVKSLPLTHAILVVKIYQKSRLKISRDVQR